MFFERAFHLAGSCVEHAGVENGKVMDLRLRALLGVLYENFWMQSF